MEFLLKIITISWLCDDIIPLMSITHNQQWQAGDRHT